MFVLHTPTKPLGSALLHLRRRYRLSQTALAERATISPFTIASIEKHRTRRPNENTLNQLATAFGLTREQLDAELGLLPYGKQVPSQHEQEHLNSVTTLDVTATERQTIALLRDLPDVQRQLFHGLLLYYHGLRYVPEWPDVVAAYQGGAPQELNTAGGL